MVPPGRRPSPIPNTCSTKSPASSAMSGEFLFCRAMRKSLRSETKLMALNNEPQTGIQPVLSMSASCSFSEGLFGSPIG